MVNRNLQRAMRSLQKRIFEHRAKLAAEPSDSPLAAHWLSEIGAWEVWLRQLEDRAARRAAAPEGIEDDVRDDG
jgi:hypothetical protein